MLYTVQTKCGEYELNVIGNPAALLAVPIKFYYGIDIPLRNPDNCSKIYEVHATVTETGPHSNKESRRV